MRTTLTYVQTRQLNNDSAATPGGSQDPVTGLPISTGTNSGDFVELTDAQAAALSDTSIGTLYGGVYMRVKRTSGDSSTPTVGQAAFWDRADTTDPYVVSNKGDLSSAAIYDWAGTIIDDTTNPGEYCWIQLTGRMSCLMTGAGAIGDFVQFPVTSTNEYIGSTGTALSTANQMGVQATAASGAGELALVDCTRAQARY